MASPLGHALAGCVIGRTGHADRRFDGRLVAICAVLAVAPDFDFLPGVLQGEPGAYHQGISHSLVFAALAGALGALVAGGGGEFPRLWLVCSAAYASHLVIDLVGLDTREPLGIPLFWPASSAHYLSPWTLLPGIDHAGSDGVNNAQWLGSLLTLSNARTLVLELVLCVPLLLGVALWARRPAAGAR